MGFFNKKKNDTAMTPISSGQSYYEEIKEIYKEMRRWRHDYHNHLQTMDALAQGEHHGNW